MRTSYLSVWYGDRGVTGTNISPRIIRGAHNLLRKITRIDNSAIAVCKFQTNIAIKNI